TATTVATARPITVIARRRQRQWTPESSFISQPPWVDLILLGELFDLPSSEVVPRSSSVPLDSGILKKNR
ncbi:MAG TPA: hypothetical protein VJT72_16180, partial [Pseudonocardiaceae bacterium]|nr:hypothetical protein [Pseudonocardiaceae bacterium]